MLSLNILENRKKNMPLIEEQYQATLDYLYSFVDYSLTRQDRLAAANFDLRRMCDLMALLGDPQTKYPVIHVAGTKGKGSTCALIASVLQQQGYKVGLYTSPHLQDYAERIQVNHENISHESLVEITERLKPFIEQVPELTTFEITTAIGFQVFADAKVDIAVIEVGLGGRLDASNIVNPLVSVITSLSFDHMNVLGNTIAQIATEKAGIIKEGKPVVLAPQDETPRLVVEQIAAERHAPVKVVGRDLLFSGKSHSLGGQSLILWDKNDQEKLNSYLHDPEGSNWKPLELTIPLLGYHQVQNAATAYAVIETARKEGIEISDEAVHKGFAEVDWPGRFELLERNPIIVIDSAHNQDSALKLRLTIDDYLPEKQVILIFGVSEDKDISGILSQLLPRTKFMVATQSTHPRALQAEKLVELAQQTGCPAVATADIPTALETAYKMADNNTAIVVAGSIFVAAAAREEWPRLKPRLNGK
jgi:dihydrofolate synthase/folylpolyglutamate synthase